MYKGRTPFLLSLILASIFLISTGQPVAAQQAEFPAGVGQYGLLESENVQNGQIVAIKEGGYKLAEQPYDSQMYGVVVLKPALAISSIGSGANKFPLVTKGTVQVLVNTQNGAIQPGDFITSSDQPGIGVKATQGGFVLGIAQAGFSESQPGLIPVGIDIKFTTNTEQNPFTPHAFASQVVNALTVGVRAAASEPNTALRYAAAALVLIVCIAFGFLLFGRSATNGIVAVGRNPLARKSIFLLVLFNIGMTVAFIVAGLAMALFILAT